MPPWLARTSRTPSSSRASTSAARAIPESLGRRREVEKWHCPADDLLGAALGIAVERRQQPGHVEGRERADRDRRMGGAGREALEDVGVEGKV